MTDERRGVSGLGVGRRDWLRFLQSTKYLSVPKWGWHFPSVRAPAARSAPKLVSKLGKLDPPDKSLHSGWAWT